MTAEEFISGLRERGYRPIRYQDGVRVILARIDAGDKLFDWLQKLGVEMVPYRLSTEIPLTYEAQLHKAKVEGDVWGAAAP